MAEDIADTKVSGQTHDSMTCKKCNGTGLMGNHLICTSCRGFGFTSPRSVPCDRCHGTGFSKSHISCDHCRGFGFLPVR